MKDKKRANHAAMPQSATPHAGAPQAASNAAAASAARAKRAAVDSGPARPEEMGADVLEFIKAMDDYRVRHNRPFPSWSEVLGVLASLGYRKVASVR
jgi:hypothetical protein